MAKRRTIGAKERDLLLTYFRKGMSAREVAELTGWSVAHMRQMKKIADQSCGLWGQWDSPSARLGAYNCHAPTDPTHSSAPVPHA